MSRFSDLLGTVLSKFQLGIGGVQLKSSGGALQVRNAADTLHVTAQAALFATYGEDFELNAGATAVGANWKMTFRRPSTGMTHALIFVMPSADPAVGQALTVASFAGDVITMQWTTIQAGTDKIVTDTTSIAFGQAASTAMFTLPANAVVTQVQVIIDTPFNGAPTLSVGITGTLSKYLSATQVDLTAAGLTVFDVVPGNNAVGTTEAITATYAPGAATVGAARVLVSYVIPS